MSDRPAIARLRIRAISRLLVCAAVVSLVGVGCADSTGDAELPESDGRPATASTDAKREGEPAEGLVVTVAASDLSVGSNRIAVNVQRTDRTRVDDAAADLTLTYESIDAPAEGGVKEAPALIWRPWPVRSGAYTTVLDFDTPGMWRLRLSHGSEDLLPGIVRVHVREEPLTPAIGAAPPLMPSKTGASPGELAQITSAAAPDPDLYRISLDDAVGSGRPAVVTFSTPAFCNSATCGPQVEVLSELEDEYGDRANFIHVEIFDNPAQILDTGDLSVARQSPLIETWGLPSEPWTFVIDGGGRVSAKFEAFATRSELEEALALAS